MLLYILIGLVAVIAIILIAASTKPNTVRYERSVAINASPEKIATHITDFHKWTAWSPWEKKDPTMAREYMGPAQGVGARYGWKGNGKVGEGTMEVLATSASEVKVDLRFIKPFKSDCIATFYFAPQGSATQVRWTMDGPNIFMGKVMSLFMNMDKMIGKDFEDGLASLKKTAEQS
ncbi:MAG TPA: SRPBCC family protein [Flavobacteriales bacterium]|nr:SRPBCC family protein [Flavobacteriales bacterium]